MLLEADVYHVAEQIKKYTDMICMRGKRLYCKSQAKWIQELSYYFRGACLSLRTAKNIIGGGSADTFVNDGSLGQYGAQNYL